MTRSPYAREPVEFLRFKRAERIRLEVEKRRRMIEERIRRAQG